ncbi:tumor necrosis factor receptor superfamily member 1B-like isoform X1 [Carassius carassius]|uniref:tumor necrosis factor receptor superfamily member 1B-like isoform X1 n=2 Tax=Carassius carassius TaxID=217509 RepID=UPI0028697A14|nr:tumor necrosis factor receptor superfamily member 1B-like isoform X1 [Carassius carassius]
MTPSTSTRNTFILLFYLIFTILHVKVIGKSGCYQKYRQGILRCERCTPECSETRNEMEFTPCTQDSNRSCFCKPGFYCTKGNNYITHCHKPCVPCGKGTFSSKPTLEFCKPHKNCAELGMIMHKEGSATRDTECVTMTTVMPSSSTTTNVITTFPITNTSIPRTGVTAPLIDTSEESQSHWLLLLILMLIILLAGFCVLMKNGAKKTLLKCPGSINVRHEDHQYQSQTAVDNQIPSNSQSQTLDTGIPLGSDGREDKGQSTDLMPQSGTVQQVTMEHNGKGENVSNTVGSIYIYSPGMVILGSNSGDKKEEAGVSEEVVPLISRPMQESNPPSQEVRIAISTQEEAEEELSLSFPVPATGK